MEQAQGNFTGTPLASDVDSARRLLQQHNDMKQSEVKRHLKYNQQKQSDINFLLLK